MLRMYLNSPVRILIFYRKVWKWSLCSDPINIYVICSTQEPNWSICWHQCMLVLLQKSQMGFICSHPCVCFRSPTIHREWATVHSTSDGELVGGTSGLGKQGQPEDGAHTGQSQICQVACWPFSKWCSTSTETIRTSRNGELRMATSTFTQRLSSAYWPLACITLIAAFTWLKGTPVKKLYGSSDRNGIKRIGWWQFFVYFIYGLVI